MCTLCCFQATHREQWAQLFEFTHFYDRKWNFIRTSVKEFWKIHYDNILRLVFDLLFNVFVSFIPPLCTFIETNQWPDLVASSLFCWTTAATSEGLRNWMIFFPEIFSDFYSNKFNLNKYLKMPLALMTIGLFTILRSKNLSLAQSNNRELLFYFC